MHYKRQTWIKISTICPFGNDKDTGSRSYKRDNYINKKHIMLYIYISTILGIKLFFEICKNSWVCLSYYEKWKLNLTCKDIYHVYIHIHM